MPLIFHSPSSAPSDLDLSMLMSEPVVEVTYYHRAFDSVDDYANLSMCADDVTSKSSGPEPRHRRSDDVSGEPASDNWFSSNESETYPDSDVSGSVSASFRCRPDFIYVSQSPDNGSISDVELVSDFTYGGPRDNIRVVSAPEEELMYEISKLKCCCCCCRCCRYRRCCR